MERDVKRGQIYIIDLDDGIGSEQEGKRPALVIQCDALNKKSPTITVAMITSQLKKIGMPEHILLPKIKGLPKQSMVLLEQLRTIDGQRLRRYCCRVDDDTMKQIDRAIKSSLGLYKKRNAKSTMRFK
jgi:Growth inhibitor